MRTDLAQRRFTDSAQTILRQIRERAIDRGLYFLDESSVPPLTLWTIIRWERKVGLATLETIGVDLHSLTDKLAVLLDTLADERPVAAKDGVAVSVKTGDRVVLDAHASIEPLLTQSEMQARSLKHDWVGSEHLLLAIIRMADSRLAAILDEHLITYECTKETVLELLSS